MPDFPTRLVFLNCLFVLFVFFKMISWFYLCHPFSLYGGLVDILVRRILVWALKRIDGNLRV
jgi:hypothetical protein